MTTTDLPTPPSASASSRPSGDLVVLRPGEPGYDSAKSTWNTVFEHRPLAVAVPRTATEVARAVEYASELGVSVAIQSTGHGPTREATDAVLIDLSRMTGVRIDPERRRAIVIGGTKWQEVLEASTPYGLAPLLGSTPDVGAIGYTLGGGLGWLARKYGASADSAVAFEVVSAEGQLVRAAEDADTELYWALRGAGAGHLGVVISMEIELYPIEALYGGNLFYPVEMAAEVLRRWRDWLGHVPDGLTSAVALENYPPMDEVPEILRGRSFVVVRGAYDGPADEGAALMDHWRSWQRPAIDLFGVMPFSNIAEISQDPLDPVPNVGTGIWMRSLSDASIDTLVQALHPGDVEPTLLFAELRHAGGAIARGTADMTPTSGRDALILLQLVAVTPTAAAAATAQAEVERVSGSLAPDVTGRGYLNFLEGDDRRYGVQAAIGEAAYRRLVAVKARLDPENRFDHGLRAMAEPAAMPSGEKGSVNKAVVREYVTRFNRGDLAGVRELFAPSAIVHGVLGWGSIDDVMPIWTALVDGLGIHLKIEDMAAEDDMVAVRMTERGWSRGPFFEEPVTGRSYEITAMEWFELRDGLVLRRWGARDSASQADQLGWSAPATRGPEPAGADTPPELSASADDLEPPAAEAIPI